MNTVIIFFAKYLIGALLLTAGIFFFQQNQKVKRSALRFAVCSLPITFLLAKIASLFFYHSRPFVTGHFTPLIAHAADNGFPSDHALLSFAVAALIFSFNKKQGAMLFALGFIISFARVAAGVHSPIDIFGSFVISVTVVAAGNWIKKTSLRERTQNHLR